MNTLATKAGRLAEREAWIKGRVTEKYKGMEILQYDYNGKMSGASQTILIIWRGKAGKPYLHYKLSSTDVAQRYIDEEKRKEDRRETWNREHPRQTMTTESAKTAKLIREILKREYPDVKFSVTSDNFANGDSVDISWVDGMPSKDIDSFARQFEYGSFDGMTDCYNYDNKREHPQAKYVHAKRGISTEKTAIIQEQLASLMGIENSPDAVIPNDYMVNVRGYAYNIALRNLVFQIAVDYDFRKGFHGVRCKTEDGQQIINAFEVY